MGEYISHLTSPIFYLRGFPPSRTAEQARARKEDSAPTLRVSRPSRTRKRASPDTELHGSVPLEV